MVRFSPDSDHLPLKIGLEGSRSEKRKSCEYRSPEGSHGAGPNFAHSFCIIAKNSRTFKFRHEIYTLDPQRPQDFDPF
jgi:hypothetical protein